MKNFLKKFKFAFIIVLVTVIITNWGRSIINNIIPKTTQLQERATVSRMNFKQIDKETLNSLDRAKEAAESFADAELDKWISEVMARVDENFLDDYFGFIQTKSREMQVLGQTILHGTHLSQKTADELMTEELEDKISKMVICPEISQRRIENITEQSIEVYLSRLDNELQQIQNNYKIPTPEWNEYIADLCSITLSIKEKSIPVSVKTAVALTGAISIAGMIPVVKIAGKVSEKIAMRAGAKIVKEAGVKVGVKTVAKTGGKTVAKVIPIIGWGVTAGIIIWDIIDYTRSAAEGKKILRENINSYLKEIKESLLSSSEGSVIGSITDWENKVKERIANR